MTRRSRHQRKQIEKALQEAEKRGFAVQARHTGHVWGHVVSSDGHQHTVFSTPRNADDAAKRIRRFVDKQQARIQETEDEGDQR